MWNPKIVSTLFLIHAVLTMLVCIRVLLGQVKMGKSPFDGWFNGMTAKAYQSEEVWKLSHQYNVKRRLFWALLEIAAALIIAFVSLPAAMVVIIYIVFAVLVINIPSMETAIYIKRLSSSVQNDAL